MRFRDESEIPDAGGQNFVKLKDGESATGVFMGEPYEFFTVWKDKKSTVVAEGTPNAKFRFRLNLVIKAKVGYEAKLFEQGPTVYRRLLKLNQEFNGLENLVVKITRHGSTINDTEYTIDPAIDSKTRQLVSVPPAVQGVQLLPLEHDKKTTSQDSPPDFGPEPEFQDHFHDEIPF